MVVNFGLLGLFEVEELTFWKKISVIVGTGKDGDCFRNRVVFDTGHSLITFGTDWSSRRDGV